jgi:hypothetical protein
MGAASARHSPRPLLEGGSPTAQLGRGNAPREGELMSQHRHCERSDAIQSLERDSGLLRFARNDAEYADTDAIIGLGKTRTTRRPTGNEMTGRQELQVKIAFRSLRQGTQHPERGRIACPMAREGAVFWSGRRGSNPRPRPWQGRALPLSYTRIRVRGAIAPPTRRPMPKAAAECNRAATLKIGQSFRVPGLIGPLRTKWLDRSPQSRHFPDSWQAMARTG